MKIYVVEMTGFDEYTTYGYYSTKELARLKLKYVYEEECKLYNDTSYDSEMHIEKVNEDLFVYKFQGRIHNEYKVKEVEVISKIEDVKHESY